MDFAVDNHSTRENNHKKFYPFRRFFQWWKAELGTLWPAKRKLPNQKYCIAYWNLSTLRFAICSYGQVEELGALSIDQGLLVDNDSAVLSKVHARRIPLVLRISNDQGIEVSDRLPQTATKELDKILSHRLDKICPWRHELAHYSVIDVTNVANERVTVRLSIVPRDTVKTAVSILESLSLSADIVDLETDNWTAPPSHNLAPWSNQPRVSRKAIATLVTLQLGLSVVAVLAGANLSAREELRDERLKQMAVLERRVNELPALRSQLDIRERSRTAIQDIHGRRVSALVIIENLSRILPNETWLDTLTIAQTHLAFSGYSSDAAALPALLENLPSFNSVTFTAPIERRAASITHEGNFISERFALRMLVNADLSLSVNADRNDR